MSENNIVTIENLTDTARKTDFRAAVKEQDSLIRRALNLTVHQIWKRDIPIVLIQTERQVWSFRDYRTAEEFEAVWIAINEERLTTRDTAGSPTDGIQTTFYEALGVSILSAIRQPLNLAIGRPRHFNFFALQQELFDWEDQFRQLGKGIDSKSLTTLMKKYVAHGPSRISQTIIPPFRKSASEQTIPQSEP